MKSWTLRTGCYETLAGLQPSLTVLTVAPTVATSAGMRQRLGLGLLIGLLVLWWWNRDAPVATTTPQPSVETVAPPTRVARSRVVLSRPSMPAPTPTPVRAEVVADEAPDPVGEPEETWVLDDLPEADRRELAAGAMAVLGELQAACAGAVDEDSFVSLTMTVDAEGLLEVEIASYDPEQAMIAEGVPLLEPLVDCLDAEIWSQEWPRWEAPLSFALTSPFDAE